MSCNYALESYYANLAYYVPGVNTSCVDGAKTTYFKGFLTHDFGSLSSHSQIHRFSFIEQERWYQSSREVM